MTTFAEIVDAAGDLSADELETLVKILQGRLREKNRKRLRVEADEALAEYAAGEAWVATPEEIMEEIRRAEDDETPSGFRTSDGNHPG